MIPGSILNVFAVIMLAVAAVSAARLVRARPWQRGAIIADTDISHLLMGIAMAGMLTAGLATLPDSAWSVVFALATAWFGHRVIRDYQASGARALATGHCAPHLAHSAAMLYMFLAITGPAAGGGAGMGGAMGGTGGGALSTAILALAFALVLAGYTIWDLDYLSSLRLGRTAAVTRGTGPVLAGALAGAVAAGAVAGSGGGGNGVAALPPAGGAAARGVAATGRPLGLTAMLDSPAVVVGCRIAMGVTMTLMLVIMI
jgi:hypothetical protein